MAFQWTSNYQFTSPSGASGTSVTPSGVAWASSPWAEIHPGSDAAWVLTSVVLGERGATTDFEADVGVVPVSGAISGCTPIATVKGCVRNNTLTSHGNLPIPIPIDAIPINHRVGIRMRKSGTGTTPWSWAIQFYKKPIVGNLEVTTQRLRALPSAAAGVNCPAASSAWGWGGWQVITASAAADMVVAAVGMNAPLISTDFEVQVGKGPASSETVLVWLKGRMSSSLTVTPGYQALYNPRDGISAGDRVVARFRKEGTSTTGPDVHILYYEKPL